MPISQLLSSRRTGMMVVTANHFQQQCRVYRVNIAVGPNSFNLVVPKAGILRAKLRHPVVQCFLDCCRLLRSQFSLGPVTITIFVPLEQLQQFFNRGAGNFWRFLQLPTLGRNPPNATRVSIPPWIAEGILRMALDRIVPVADIECPAWPKTNVHGNETQVC